MKRHSNSLVANACKADKYRSATTAKILRDELREHNDHNLAKWTDSATVDLMRFAHMEGSENKNTKGTYWTALRRIREGVEVWGGIFYPQCLPQEVSAYPGTVNERNAYHVFMYSRLKDVRDMARLNSNAE